MRTGPGSTLRAVLVRLAVLLGLGVLALGLRAGSPLDADARGWRLDDLADRGGSTLRVVLFAWVAAALAVAVWSVVGGGGRGTGRRPRRSLVSTFVLLFAFVLATYALVHYRRGPAAGVPPPDPAPSGTPAPAGQGGVAHAGAGLLLLAVLAAVVVASLVLAARRRPAPAEPVAEEVLADGLAAAARVLRARVEDDPRERVLAAYEAFEAALADRGVQRRPSGTPSALLALAVQSGADAARAAELTRLFGAARFGVDPVTESDVDEAERCLDALLADA